MNKKDLVIVALATFCLTSTLFLILPSRSADYDPWADVSGPTQGTEDGTINMRDISYLIGLFGTSGSATKNVSVTNWPVANQQTIFYEANHSSSSGYYNASGFGHIHITWWVGDLSDPESISFELYGIIYAPSGVAIQSVIVETWRATENDNFGAMTIPVPSEMFHFYAGFAVGTTARVHLAFYLTYA